MLASLFTTNVFLSASRTAGVSPIKAFISTTEPRSSKSDTSRPFQILGIQQVAIGCAEREPLDRLWNGIFGLQPSAIKRIESENVKVKLGVRPYEVEIDLMTPIDADKSPKVHAPPLNHIGLWVDHLELAVEWMEERGVRFTPGGIREGATGHNVVFIHPKGNEEAPIGGAGVLIELVQAPEEVIEAFTTNNKK